MLEAKSKTKIEEHSSANFFNHVYQEQISFFEDQKLKLGFELEFGLKVRFCFWVSLLYTVQ